MKKGMILGLLLAASLMAQAEQVTIETKRSTMVLNVENGKQPQYVYFGQKLSDWDGRPPLAPPIGGERLPELR